jgi:predicted Zn-dependent protease
MEAATASASATTKQGAQVDVRFVAIRAGADAFYRFLFVSPPEATAQLEPAFRATALSFHRLTEKEAALAQPLRIRVHQVRAGETAESLAQRMPFEHRLERFLVLNALPQGAPLQPGTMVKLVEEGGRR